MKGEAMKPKTIIEALKKNLETTIETEKESIKLQKRLPDNGIAEWIEGRKSANESILAYIERLEKAD